MELMNLPEGKRLAAGFVIALLLVGGGGIIVGRMTSAPDSAVTEAGGEEAANEEGHVEGLVEMTAARAKAAGIVTEVVQTGTLGAEIITQGVVAPAPDGEAVLTARADGAIVRINRRLGDPVGAGEAVALLESREAATLAADRSTALAKLALARSTYERERKLFEAKVTARQDLEAARAVLSEAEAEVRRSQTAANASKVSSDGRVLAVTSLISGRVTRVVFT